ncbi:Putative nuclease HARBI1 [Araneus ventricosus]|uniref:Nuclease HARBI1 n=1 Tax=Araneus ventricosus TaxID=182803 RepID=A0A4Y2FZZ0_ARAVE|nr:Putative nuclease HARBI1 [Araneus ventricosus]
MTDDDLSYLDDIESLEILEIIERRMRSVHPDRANDLDCMDNVSFRSRYRLNKDTAESLIQMLDDTLSAPSEKNYALSSTEKVLIALRYYATGSFQLVLGDLAKVSQSSASRAINDVSKALASLRPNYIRLPQTGLELRQVSQEFYRNSGFPAVYGAIDCSHIPIINPGGDLAEVAVLENEVPPEYHLVGDNGYACRSYLLTPFLDPSTPQEIRYNVAHKAARNVVERQYGIMKRRFACLATSLRCSLQNAMTVIVAIAVLHNIALQMDDVFEEIIEEEDDEGNTPTVANHAAGLAKRNALLSTFFNN